MLCWGDLFSLVHVCGYPYVLLKGQCVYGLYSFGGAEQVRPLHTPYLKSGSQDEVRPLQAPLLISLCALLGWSFFIRLYLWVSVCSPKGSVCLCFVQFWWDRTSETIAHTLLEIWVTGWSETTTSTSNHITLCFVGGDLGTQRRWSNEKTSPNKTHGVIMGDACSGLTLVSDAFFQAKLYKP